MARGHQKIQSQKKAQEKQDKMKKSQGSDQKKAAQAALKYSCPVCKVRKMQTKNSAIKKFISSSSIVFPRSSKSAKINTDRYPALLLSVTNARP